MVQVPLVPVVRKDLEAMCGMDCKRTWTLAPSHGPNDQTPFGRKEPLTTVCQHFLWRMKRTKRTKEAQEPAPKL